MDRKKNSWPLPHLDAEYFFDACISYFDHDTPVVGTEEDIPKDAEHFNHDPVDAMEEDNEFYDQLFDGYYEPGTADWQLKFGTDPVFEIDDSLVRYQELLKNARNALKQRVINDMIMYLGELSLMYRQVSDELPWTESEVENWAEVLDRFSKPKEDVHETNVKILVRELCIGLCEMIVKNPFILQKVEWRQMEQLVSVCIEGLGFCVELTRPAKDLGRDVIATCVIKGKLKTYYIEIKHWKAGGRVGPKELKKFIQLNVYDQTDGGIILSTGGFRQSIYSYLGEMRKHRIRLGSQKKIITLCQRFHRSGYGIWRPDDPLPKILFENTM